MPVHGRGIQERLSTNDVRDNNNDMLLGDRSPLCQGRNSPVTFAFHSVILQPVISGTYLFVPGADPARPTRPALN